MMSAFHLAPGWFWEIDFANRFDAHSKQGERKQQDEKS